MQEAGLILIRGLITIAVSIPISALILFLSSKKFKLSNQSFKTAILAALSVDIIGYIIDSFNRLLASGFLFTMLDWIITFALGGIALLVVKIFYKESWGKSALVWLVWLLIYMIAGIIINFILTIFFVLTGLIIPS